MVQHGSFFVDLTYSIIVIAEYMNLKKINAWRIAKKDKKKEGRYIEFTKLTAFAENHLGAHISTPAITQAFTACCSSFGPSKSR